VGGGGRETGNPSVFGLLGLFPNDYLMVVEMRSHVTIPHEYTAMYGGDRLRKEKFGGNIGLDCPLHGITVL